MTCADCRHFKSFGNHGQCRRHAPVITDSEHAKRWPMVQADDWCGDHQGRPDEFVGYRKGDE